MKTTIIISVTILLALCSSAMAEEMVFDLDGAILYALEHNRSLKVDSYDEEIAALKIDEANAGFLPKLSLNGSYSVFDNISVSTISLGSAPMSFQSQPDRASSIGLSLTQPIFTGGALINGYQLSRLGRDIAKDKTSSNRSDLIRQIKETYLGILLSRELIKVSEESIEVAQAHLNVAKARYDVGLASRYDVLRGEVQVANLKPSLINMQNTLTNAKLGLGILLGLSEGQTADVSGSLSIEPFEITLEDCIAKARAQRPELSLMRRSEEVAERSLALARSAYYPKVFLIGGYTHSLNEYNMGASFGSASWSDLLQGTLSLQWDFFDGWAASAKIKQALIAKTQTRANLDQLDQSVRMEVENYYNSFLAAKETVASQEMNVENGKEGLRIAEARYKEGLMQSVDVMDAQLALNLAQTNYYKAIYDYQVAIARLKKAMNDN